MPRSEAQYTPSTNLADDLGKKQLLDKIIFSNQIKNTLSLYDINKNLNENSAVSIVGPYGSGKSTTALVLYHYLTNSLNDRLMQQIHDADIKTYNSPYDKKEIKVLVGRKTSLENSLKLFFKIKGSIVDYFKKNIETNNRMIIIIDEFGKYLEYSNDDPKSSDVYILQELAELAIRSKGLFKIITIFT